MNRTPGEPTCALPPRPVARRFAERARARSTELGTSHSTVVFTQSGDVLRVDESCSLSVLVG